MGEKSLCFERVDMQKKPVDLKRTYTQKTSIDFKVCLPEREIRTAVNVSHSFSNPLKWNAPDVQGNPS
jgi:hypothetical protein